MKNSEKPKFPFLVDVRDYLSNTMIMKSNREKLNNTETNVLFKSLEMSENKRPFDLFAHILEG
ncbi:MAG: hypothetical protein PHT07_22030 [Paludibacter sp.]|nr:hypothetical protein [Paludibacter sp.]